jgi:hypothetical protein
MEQSPGRAAKNAPLAKASRLDNPLKSGADAAIVVAVKDAGFTDPAKSEPPGGAPTSGVRASSGPLRVRRTCASCGVDLESKPRTKNVDGDYRCIPCHRRRKVVREAVRGVRRRLRRFGSLGVVALVMGVALTGVMRSCNEPAPPPAEGGP